MGQAWGNGAWWLVVGGWWRFVLGGLGSLPRLKRENAFEHGPLNQRTNQRRRVKWRETKRERSREERRSV